MIVARQIPREGERDGPRKIAVLSVSAAKGEDLPRLATSVSVNKLIYCCQGLTAVMFSCQQIQHLKDLFSFCGDISSKGVVNSSVIRPVFDLVLSLFMKRVS